MAETAPIRLGSVQRRVLARIVKTNGGGVSQFDLTPTEKKAMWRLHEMKLVQGKSGMEHRAVHTREGLELHRRLEEQEQ
jgi:hypothetical protein